MKQDSTTQLPQLLQMVLFRDDLRTMDNPALLASCDAGSTVAVFILDEQSQSIRALGAAAHWWLHYALVSLEESLGELGIPLILRRGASADIVAELSRDYAPQAIRWNRRYGHAERAVDAQLKLQLQAAGVDAHSYAASLLHEPWELLTKNQTGYKVFTPFYNTLRNTEVRLPFPAPSAQAPIDHTCLHSENLEEWGLLPSTPDWAAGLRDTWTPGEPAARQRLSEVLEAIAGDYVNHHDRPDLDGTSALSPALRWGHLSAHQLWDELSRLAIDSPSSAEGATALRRQVAWRDFCWHLYYHHPQLPTENLRKEFDDFDWSWPSDSPEAADLVNGWQRGRTGFALVDAGMNQLWQTGWMHNRVRMVTASLLVKNLAIHWRVGEQWFWDTLVDADIASNTANWQWVAGCGADAAPYFRIFNPELQAKKFDPQGSYVAKYAPLAAQPLVDQRQSRTEALESYNHMKSQQQ